VDRHRYQARNNGHNWMGRHGKERAFKLRRQVHPILFNICFSRASLLHMKEWSTRTPHSNQLTVHHRKSLPCFCPFNPSSIFIFILSVSPSYASIARYSMTTSASTLRSCCMMKYPGQVERLAVPHAWHQLNGCVRHSYSHAPINSASNASPSHQCVAFVARYQHAARRSLPSANFTQG